MPSAACALDKDTNGFAVANFDKIAVAFSGFDREMIAFAGSDLEFSRAVASRGPAERDGEGGAHYQQLQASDNFAWCGHLGHPRSIVLTPDMSVSLAAGIFTLNLARQPAANVLVSYGFGNDASGSLTSDTGAIADFPIEPVDEVNIGDGAGSATAAFNDLLNDTNGKALAAHVPDDDASAGGWSEDNGAWEIQGNAAIAKGAAPAAPLWLATFAGGAADGIAQGTFNFAGPALTAGLVFRYQDNDNYWNARIIPASNSLRMDLRFGGTTFNVGTFALPAVGSANQVIRAIFAGNHIEVQVNGVTYYYVDDANLNAATRYGARATDTLAQMKDIRFKV